MAHVLPDSITEWGILAISASPLTGRRRSRGKPWCPVLRTGFAHVICCLTADKSVKNVPEAKVQKKNIQRRVLDLQTETKVKTQIATDVQSHLHASERL